MSGLELELESVTSNTIRSVSALIGKRGGGGMVKILITIVKRMEFYI